MVWPLNRLRRRPAARIDATGPATRYPGHAGALSPSAVRELEDRRRAGAHGPTTVDRACDPWAASNQRGTR